MNRFATCFLAVSLVGSGASCGKKEDAPAKPAAEAPKATGEPAKPTGDPAKPTGEPAKPTGDPAKPTGEPAKAGPTVRKTFDDLKQVSLEVPEGTEMLSAVTNEFVQVSAENFVVGVSVATMAASETFAEEKADAEKNEVCTFTSWVKSEETPDGWLLHYRCKGPDEFEGHKVDIRKKVGETVYECGWDFVKTAAEAEAIIKSCQSLKPAS